MPVTPGRSSIWSHPLEFNEKIQWLKVYFKDPRLTQLVAKYNVRSCVREKVGEKYLNELSVII